MDRKYKLSDFHPDFRDKILECPQCKTKDHIIIQRYDYDGGESYFGVWEEAYTSHHIECVQCDLYGDPVASAYHPLNIDEETLIANWNYRVNKKNKEIGEEE